MKKKVLMIVFSPKVRVVKACRMLQIPMQWSFRPLVLLELILYIINELMVRCLEAKQVETYWIYILYRLNYLGLNPKLLTALNINSPNNLMLDLFTLSQTGTKEAFRGWSLNTHSFQL